MIYGAYGYTGRLVAARPPSGATPGPGLLATNADCTWASSRARVRPRRSRPPCVRASTTPMAVSSASRPPPTETPAGRRYPRPQAPAEIDGHQRAGPPRPRGRIVSLLPGSGFDACPPTAWPPARAGQSTPSAGSWPSRWAAAPRDGQDRHGVLARPAGPALARPVLAGRCGPPSPSLTVATLRIDCGDVSTAYHSTLAVSSTPTPAPSASAAWPDGHRGRGLLVRHLKRARAGSQPRQPLPATRAGVHRHDAPTITPTHTRPRRSASSASAREASRYSRPSDPTPA